MTINLIASVFEHQGKLAIGSMGNLAIKIKRDMDFFSKITRFSSNKSKTPNIVLMGRKTYFSIPEKNRPLVDRINIVLTNSMELLSDTFTMEDITKPYFMNFNTFLRIYLIYNPTVFVIGGGEVYNQFLSGSMPQELQPKNLYITQVTGDPSIQTPDCFMDHPSSKFKLIGYSPEYAQESFSFRFLIYTLHEHVSEEFKYLNFAKEILEKGISRIDRTKIGTKSIFGAQLHFDISKSVPMLTTKKISFKSILEELLWICRGDTDSKILSRNGVKIWDKNTSRKFLDERGLEYREGVLGPGYGWQLRHQGGAYKEQYADTAGLCIGGFDQLEYVIDLLKNDPFSRRIMISFWNPSDFHMTALLPCHVTVQFYVTERNGEKHLSCHFMMRSNDIFLGNPFNLMSYTLLTYILALKCGMVPDKLVYTCGDAHIYNNHVIQIKEQISRTPRPLPGLDINPEVKTKDWVKMSLQDFKLVGYFPHPGIKADMAI